MNPTAIRFRIGLSLVALFAPAIAGAQQVFKSSAGNLAVETVAGGLVHPWSLAFLPDGRMLVSERPGRLRIVTRAGQLSPPLAGVPAVYAQSQAGLMDVMLARDFAKTRTIYFCYAEHAEGGGGRIAVAHAQLEDNGRAPRLVAVTTIFRQRGPASRGLNIGCRIAQAPDGNLFVTLGDHFAAAEMAQTLDNHIGKIVRIAPDGKAPPDNPFVGKPGALPEIWAYGLRNPEGLAFNPADGRLWEQEHGPQGGDEINIIEKGKNYGWNGSLINGALKFELLSRLTLEGDSAVREERLLQGLGERIRDVRQGPDGALYLLTDNSAGRILRVAPAK